MVCRPGDPGGQKDPLGKLVPSDSRTDPPGYTVRVSIIAVS